LFTVLGGAVCVLCGTGTPGLAQPADASVTYTFTHLAGTPGGAGAWDSSEGSARFSQPYAVAVDSSGTIYVADTSNHTIRKITTGGVVMTLAGLAGVGGSADGLGAAARFSSPQGITVGSDGIVYVGDTGNHTIRKITPAGVVSTLAGWAGATGSNNGTGSVARFNGPRGVSVESGPGGAVYVADTSNNAIRKVTAAGVVTTLASGFGAPYGVVVHTSGTVYVADTYRHQIRAVSTIGEVSLLAGSGGAGYADGTGVAAVFNYPQGLGLDADGNVYVADTFNHRLRMVTPAGVVTTLAGSSEGYTDGTPAAAKFYYPRSIALAPGSSPVGSTGVAYVADSANHAIRWVSTVVGTHAGWPPMWGTTDASGTAARFWTPRGIAVGPDGSVYVDDAGNGTIRKITAVGVVTTLATVGPPDPTGSYEFTKKLLGGTPDFWWWWYSTWNQPAFGRLAVDASGNVYLGDTAQHVIRKVSPTGVVSTFAGLAGSSGSSDGTGGSARFYLPTGLAVDGSGNLYVADTGNNTIRKITPAAVVSTLAGIPTTYGTWADGTGNAARFSSPTGLATDASGNVYVADTNNRAIRRVTPAGVVTTLAGVYWQAGAIDGVGSAARFVSPSAVAVNGDGDVLVVDVSTHTLRRVTPGGVVTTLAGVTSAWGAEDGAGSAARFAGPTGIAVSAAGTVYVADAANNAIRKATTSVESYPLTVRKAGGATGTTSPSSSQTYTAGAVATVTATPGAGAVFAGWGGDCTGTGACAVTMTQARTVVAHFVPATTTTYNLTVTREGYDRGTPSPTVTGTVTSQPAGVNCGSTCIAAFFEGQIVSLTAVAAGNAVFSGWSGACSGTGTCEVPMTSARLVTARFDASATLTVNRSGQGGVASQPAGIACGAACAANFALDSVAALTARPALASTFLGWAGACAGSGNCQVTMDAARAVTATFVTAVDASQAYSFTHLAGSTGGPGSTDGAGTAARFSQPVAAAVDAAGNVYVADTANHVIRKVTPAGVVTTLAGLAGVAGSADGVGAAARFSSPQGIAVDTSGVVFVGDTGNHTIRRISGAGVVTTLAGYPGASGSNNATGSLARFNGPRGVAVDGGGNVYVADTNNHVIRKVTAAGVVTTTGFSGLWSPPGVAVDAAGSTIYATSSHQIYMFAVGSGITTTLAGSTPGFADGTGAAALFNGPSALAVAGGGTLYVADVDNYRIRVVTAAGVVTTLAGSSPGSADGTGSAASFNRPRGVALGGGGLYVADSGNHTIRGVTLAGVVTTFAGLANTWGMTDGTGAAARFSTPRGIGVGPDGTVYVYDADTGNVRKVSPAGVVTTFANTGGAGGAGIGQLAVDAVGNVYVSDVNAHVVRKIDPAGAVTILAGLAGVPGGSDGPGSVARLTSPRSVAVDMAGFVYVVSDASGGYGYGYPGYPSTVRRVSPTGMVTTLAQGFSTPSGLAVDGDGVVYVGDASTRSVYKITPDGTVTPFAYPVTDGYSHVALALDGQGHLLVADAGTHTIRRISATGVVTLVAGLTGAAGAADGPGGTARFNMPAAIAVGADGVVYVADGGNHAVRAGTVGPEAHALTALVVGPAPGGSVSSVPTGISCGTDCHELYAPGTVVTLTANAGAGVTFTGWSGACSGGGTCSVMMSEARTVAANFAPSAATAYTLTVGRTGSGSGLVVSQRYGIDCGSTCSAAFYSGELIALTPTASGGSVFAGWSGACTGTGACAVSMTAARSVTATFSSAFGLTVQKVGSGGVGSQPEGIACGTACAASFVPATSVALFARPTLGHIFDGWSGEGCSGTGTCQVTLSAPRQVTAAFTTAVDASETYSFTHLAGSLGGSGWADGTGSAARFYQPYAVALDGSGNVYVADTSNHVVRKITSAGVVTTLAGLAGSPGSADGSGTAARFSSPQGIAVDASGNVYVADTANHTIRRVTSAGAVTTLAGVAESSGLANGTGAAARFFGPRGLAIDGSGVVYVADTSNNAIRKVTSAGDVTTLAATGFNQPYGVAVDGSGTVYVANTNAHRIEKVTSGGAVSTLAGSGFSGFADGTGTGASFWLPHGVAVNAAGSTIYVADTVNQRIRAITSAGVVTTVAGNVSTGSSDGTGAAALFYNPRGVALTTGGDLYVADSGNHTVRRMTAAAAVTTFAGLVAVPGTTDATGSAARFSTPRGLAVAPDGTVYVDDAGNGNIRRITPAGVVTTFASVGGAGGGGYGRLAIDQLGNLYAADMTAHVLRKVTPAGSVSVLAGLAGVSGFSNGQGAEARFFSPGGVAVDTTGVVYVSDTGNGCIRKVSPSGYVTTIACGVLSPQGLAVDGNGDVYVASAGTRMVTKVTPAGVVTPVAGWTNPAESPSAIALDHKGHLLVADISTHTLRRITAAGVVTTVAGREGWPGATDGVGGTVRFSSPAAIAVGPTGVVYVADSGNHAIRAANVVVESFLLTVTREGQGSGTVTSDEPAGISCGADCEEAYAAGTDVTLSASAAAGSVFSGWSGACTGTGTCSVRLTGNTSVTATFTLLPPTVTTVAPAAGSVAGGTPLTITGTNFLSPATVSVGGVSAGNVVVVNNSTITAVAPVGLFAGTVGVSVTTPGGTVTLPNAFTYLPLPVITSVSPSAGPLAGGTAITIAGTGFLPGTAVAVGGVSATNVVVLNATTVTAVTPAVQVTGTVAVSLATLAGVAVLPGAFTYQPVPAVSGVAPGAGPLTGGTAITITGTGFVAGATVAVGGTAATSVVVVNATTITAITPPRAVAGAVSVSVSTPGGTGSRSSAFTYQVAPTITQVSPNAGPLAGGTPITVTGTGFTTGASLRIGGAVATSVLVVNPTTLTAVTPSGVAGAATASVTTAGGTGSLPNAFNYLPAPTVTGVSPGTGPLAGGTTITMLGTGFAAGATVAIGGFEATAVVAVDATTLTAVTPAASTAGARDVRVTTPVGTFLVPNGFTYVAETATDVLDGGEEEPLPPGSDFLEPALSGNGLYLAYVVTSEKVIAGDTNGVPDIVVRDQVTGATTRVSVSSDGAQANGASGRPRISADGRYVAFWSVASTLVAGDTNGVRDVFLHDRDADGNGVFDEVAVGARTTTRVSVATSGAQGNAASAANGDELVQGIPSDAQLDLSPDGLWVAFRSAASNLVAGDTNGVEDIFLRNVTGQQTTRVSVAADGTEANGASQSPGVSAGAQRVAFASKAANLVASDRNGLQDVFVVERASGQVVRLSEPSSGGDSNGASDAPSIDDAGRTVAFATLSTNILPALGTSTTSQVLVVTLPASASETSLALPGLVAAAAIDVSQIVKQLASGVMPPGTATVQPGNGPSTQPEVCGSGTCVGYATRANNLTPEDPDTNDVPDVVKQPVLTPPPAAPPQPERMSKDSAGNQATKPTTAVALSTDGTTVAMQSEAPLTVQAAAANPEGVNVFVRTVPLAVATISRTSARTDVSETLVFTGRGFQQGVQVLFGAAPVGGTVEDEGRKLSVATPTGGAAGVASLTVRNPDGSSVGLFQAFTFLAPPATAPTGDADGDGLPDAWEDMMGLDPQSAAGANGATADPDADGRTNLQEYTDGTHPNGTFTRFLAEGATSSFFTTLVGLANASTTGTAHAWLRFQRSDGEQVSMPVTVPPMQSRSVVANAVAGLETAEFSTLVEADTALAVHRMQTWDAVRGYGSHLEAAVLAPATQWYLAEGSTAAGFQLFYLIQNPGTAAADVEVRFLLPSGPPIVKNFTVAAGSRFNVWVNTLPEVSNTDCSAVITSSNGVPIIVERAMYLDGPGLPFGAGHESAGVTAPAGAWFLAEGATGAYFDLFVLVANPNATAAELWATYLLPDGTTVEKAYTVAPNSRFNIWVDYEDPKLANTAVSTTVRSTNGVPVLVERAMWWPQTPGWWEAHGAFGATQPGTLWALGTGEVGGAPANASTYVLVANTSAWDATVKVSVLFEDGTVAVTRTFDVKPTSRFNVDVGYEFPEVRGRRFGVVVESLPTGEHAAAQIVVEGAQYHDDTAGVVWAAGANALATRLR
jgi:streptogramin lyase